MINLISNFNLTKSKNTDGVVVQAWVGHKVKPLTLLDTCLQMTSDKNQMRPHKKHKQHHKHHHHGGEAACPSRGVDLMNPCRWRGGRPAAKFSDAVVAGF